MSLITELSSLKKEINEIFNSNMSWELKYDLIFSEKLSQQVFELVDLDYYDPDTTYEEDVTAFVKALNDKCQDLS